MTSVDMGGQAGIRKPRKKLYYSLKQAGQMMGLGVTVLKGWEKHFPEIKPVRNRAGSRYYTEKDLHLLLQIKEFLYDRKLSFKEAQMAVSAHLQEIEENEKIQLKQVLAEVKLEVREILDLFEG